MSFDFASSHDFGLDFYSLDFDSCVDLDTPIDDFEVVSRRIADIGEVPAVKPSRSKARKAKVTKKPVPAVPAVRENSEDEDVASFDASDMSGAAPVFHAADDDLLEMLFNEQLESPAIARARRKRAAASNDAQMVLFA